MSTYKTISIVVESIQAANEMAVVHALCREIYHLLDILARTGEGAVVDLRALPRIGPLGYGFLKDWLSIGEVHAVISGLRQSEIRETAFAGVWWVTHRNEKDEIVTELLEVTEIPSLLKSQQEDIVAGLKTMRDVLPVR